MGITSLSEIKFTVANHKLYSTNVAEVKVYARGTDDVEIQGVILLALPTIAQTSGCLILLHYDQKSDKESLNILPTLSIV